MQSVGAKLLLSHNCLSSSSDLPNQEAEGTGHTGHFPTFSERRLLSGDTGWDPPDVRPMLQVCCGILPIKVLSAAIKMPPAGFNFPNGSRGGLKDGPGNGAEINVERGLVETSGFSESTQRACPELVGRWNNIKVSRGLWIPVCRPN